jgi:hypothetical protein
VSIFCLLCICFLFLAFFFVLLFLPSFFAVILCEHPSSNTHFSTISSLCPLVILLISMDFLWTFFVSIITIVLSLLFCFSPYSLGHSLCCHYFSQVLRLPDFILSSRLFLTCTFR